MIRLTGALLAALLLAPLAAWAQTGNPAHDALAARVDSDRRGELQRLVQGRGFACTAVLSAYFAGLDQARNAYWDVRCREGAMYRGALPAARWGQPSFLTCGAQAPAPAGGPCFQPVTAAITLAAASAGGGQAEGMCRATCATQPASAQNACIASCTSGTGMQRGQQVADQLPANSRFGAIYATVPPMAAIGFGNGETDRLAVNRSAVTACQRTAGRVPCLFVRELVNTCGAVAQAISRHPNAIAMTSDPSTQVLNLTATATGRTQREAEAGAMAQCEREQPIGAVCRIVAAGC